MHLQASSTWIQDDNISSCDAVTWERHGRSLNVVTDRDSWPLRSLTPKDDASRRLLWLPKMNLAGTVEYPLIAGEHRNDGRYHLLLAASGSVATIKLPDITNSLSTLPDISIRIVVTKSASQFLQGQSDEQPTLHSLLELSNVDGIYCVDDEWNIPWTRGAPILHIELRRWADMLVIAPLSANTLSDIACGRCNSLLTSVVRAWQVEVEPGSDKQRRIVIAPAMNTAMWRNPITAHQLADFGFGKMFHWFDVLEPVQKELACRDVGDGAMHDWQDIVSAIQERIREQGIVRNKGW